MTRKIIHGIGVLVVLGLATFFLYPVLSPEGDHQTSAPEPAAPRQGAVRSMSESPPQPSSSQPGPDVPKSRTAPDPHAGPASQGPRVPAAAAPGEPKMVRLPPLEPTEEEGLLAGRYRTFESAKKRMEKIKGQGIPAFIRQEGKFYEVWAGPFATPEEAEQARKSLHAALKISAKKRKLIIPVPK